MAASAGTSSGVVEKGPVDHNAEHRNHSHSHGHGEVDFAEIDPNDTDLLGEF